jgi:hypothetical protein
MHNPYLVNQDLQTEPAGEMVEGVLGGGTHSSLSSQPPTA